MTYAHRKDIYDADTHMMEHPNWIYDFASEDIKEHLEPIVEGDKEVSERIDKAIANDENSYQYLVESIRKFPEQNHFSRLLTLGGFDNVKYRNFSFGIAAIHSGWKL